MIHNIGVLNKNADCLSHCPKGILANEPPLAHSIKGDYNMPPSTFFVFVTREQLDKNVLLQLKIREKGKIIVSSIFDELKYQEDDCAFNKNRVYQRAKSLCWLTHTMNKFLKDGSQLLIVSPPLRRGRFSETDTP